MATGFLSIFLKKKKQLRQGFTIIELIVTMSIMVFLLATVMANYPESSVRVNLAIITHETSLAVREAQLRGSAVDSKDLSIGGYGIYFSRVFPSGYVYFSDIGDPLLPWPNGLPVGDGMYSTLSGADETIATTTYPRNFAVTKLCTGKGYPFIAGNGGSCNDDQANSMPIINTLTVNFTRPKPKAVITINQDDVLNKRTLLTGTCIEIVSPRGGGPGNVRSVQVYASGRIMTSSEGCQ